MSINALDLVIAVIIAATAIIGAIKGFVKQIIGILSILAGVWCAFKGSSWLVQNVRSYIPAGEKTLYIVCFIIIVVVVILLGYLLGRFIEKIIEITTLGWINRVCGALLGAAKAILLIAVVVYIFDKINNAYHLVGNGSLNDSILWVKMRVVYKEIFPYLSRLKF